MDVLEKISDLVKAKRVPHYQVLTYKLHFKLSKNRCMQ